MNLGIWLILNVVFQLLYWLIYLACIVGIVIMFVLRLQTPDVKRQKKHLIRIILLAILWLIMHIIAIVIFFGPFIC